MPDNISQMPLSLAVFYGHEGVAKILLGREEVNPDKADYGGRTPLSLAAQNRHEEVVILLHSSKVVAPSVV